MYIAKDIIAQLEKKQYAVSGHSGVQICTWNKKALQGRGVCYKQIFYGVHTHRCMQFSPAAVWCSNSCIYCWRPMELMSFTEFKNEVAEPPHKIVTSLIELRKRLLSGFGGRVGTERRLWQESLDPDHFAVSLSGEPCIYPHLPQLIKHLKLDRHARSVFLVTNGTFPAMLERLAKEGGLPDQLYLSVVAHEPELYKRIANPKASHNWEHFLRSAQLLHNLPTRTIVRFTLIRGWNDAKKEMRKLAHFLENIGADFIEIKGYMFLGYSRRRLNMENMPLHSEVSSFSQELCALMGLYEIIDEHPPSRIVLLRNKKTRKSESLFPLEEPNQGTEEAKKAASE